MGIIQGTIRARVASTPLSISGFPNEAQLSYIYAAWTPTITGGTPPYSVTVVAGSLPAGISINNVATGQLAGTPSGAPGTSSFTLRVTDAIGNTADLATSIQTFDAPAFQVISRSVAASGNNQQGVAFLIDGRDSFPGATGAGPIVDGWVLPSRRTFYTATIGSNYQARVTSVTGSITGLNGRTIGVWYDIDGVDGSVTSALFARTPAAVAGVMNIEIRRKSDLVVVATGTITYS